MLVLSRKLGQRIILSIDGVSATIEVVRLEGNRVRLGISAPNEVAIQRSELISDEGMCPDAEIRSLLTSGVLLSHV